MLSRTYAVCLCCVFLGAFRSARTAYLRPDQLDEISGGMSSQEGSPGMVLIALCWDSQNVLTECRRRSILIKQMLNKLLHSMETQTRKSSQEVLTDERENGYFRNTAKRTSGNASGFYSNW
ncbi:hypothetical protein BsWGS_28716 [Bradybaena similaris]